MLDKTKKILKYKTLTQRFPKTQPDMSLWSGSPLIKDSKCIRCGQCVKGCPVGAITGGSDANMPKINYDQCIFCMLCNEICPTGAVELAPGYKMAHKGKLIINTSFSPDGVEDSDVACDELGRELKSKINKLFGRSLMIREVDAGSCNGCDSEINALSNPFNDIERFGISFVASPRHADMLMVTGIGTRNMQEALKKTYQATPDPKLVIAVGACACSGGIFRDTYASGNGIDSIVPVDVYIPGCPPRPQAIIYGIMKALDR